MQKPLKAKLSFFMFLQYFIWSSWYVSLGTYAANVLKFSGEQIGAAYGAFAIGAMISPFFVGLVADRYFATEKMLAALGILGGVALCALPKVSEFKSFYPMLVLYCALYAPTLALGFMTPTPSMPLSGPGAFGHPGAGGSLGFADPEAGIGFGYIANRMSSDGRDARAAVLVAAIVDCLG